MFFFINNLQREQAKAQARKTAQAVSTQVAADRSIYTEHVVGKLKADGIPIDPKVNFHSTAGGIPLPATFVHLTSDFVNKAKNGVYTVDLMSTDPVNKSKEPVGGSFEYNALSQMNKDTIIDDELNVETKLYTAVTPDFASADACVNCHNELQVHNKTVQHGDVLGGLVIKMPLDRELSEAQKKAVMLTFGLLVSFLALLGLQWVLVNRPLIQSITQLEQAADRVSRGDVDTPVTTDRSDEIGRLTRAFDRMRVSVAAAMQAAGGGEDEDGL
jgi:HAMP domain-containing protein